MAAASIDTHKLFKTLEAAGFEPAKADAILSVASGLRDSAEVATKSDLRELELRMTIKLGGMMAAAIGVTAVLVKLL